MIRFLIGGARSGKSRHAQQLAEAFGLPVMVIATGEAKDAEMAARIAQHQAERPAHWCTVEEPLDLAGAICAHAGPECCVLVDCLTLWLNNWMDGEVAGYAKARQELLEALGGASGEVILVANEVGLGVIPMGALSRRFVDEAGRLNQEIAALADEVLFLAAGLPLVLKRGGT